MVGEASWPRFFSCALRDDRVTFLSVFSRIPWVGVPPLFPSGDVEFGHLGPVHCFFFGSILKYGSVCPGLTGRGLTHADHRVPSPKETSSSPVPGLLLVHLGVGVGTRASTSLFFSSS